MSPVKSNTCIKRQASFRRWGAAWLACALLSMCVGCLQEMVDQSRLEPLEASDFFADGKSAREPVVGTVARGEQYLETPFFTGKRDGELVTEFPADPRTSESPRMTREVLERGQARFEIYCAMCHGRTGEGDGMVVRRGFRRPPSLHEQRLREASPGYFFEVITDGFKTMPAQGSRVAPRDRWAIIAYLRALQQSQHVVLENAPADIRRQFE